MTPGISRGILDHGSVMLNLSRWTNRILVIVLRSIATILTNETRRRLLAALFLFVFFAEFGSHTLICSNQSSNEKSSFSINERGHDDPCKTLVLCSDGQRKDRQLPSFGHDAAQHNALFDQSAFPQPDTFDLVEVAIPFSTDDGLFRPPDPPFHPPRLS